MSAPSAVRVRALSLALALGAAGCVARSSMHRVVLDYDEAMSRAQAEMLLLNVARARHRRPLHFTTVSGIAATFDHETSAGLAGELAEGPGISILMPSVGVRASENPTISIVPIQGEEFTRRLLTPLDESVVGFFYHQGADPDLLVRLIAHGLVQDSDGARAVHLNDPVEGDAGFERFALRLAALDRARRLDVGELVLEDAWDLQDFAPGDVAALADLLERGFELSQSPGSRRLSRRVAGRQVIADYDLATLSNAERLELQRRALQYPSSFVLVDLRGAAAGEERLSGWLKLRSLGAILDATARAIGVRDGAHAQPALSVVESSEPLEDSLFSVAYEGAHYAVVDDDGHRSPRAFDVLYRLYQMTVSELPGAALPNVTIAK